jgi:hypothetical protein
MELAKKPCLECGEPVGKGRVDRKFCSVECKNKHHNKESFEDKMSTGKVRKILEKNRSILKEMYKRKDNHEIEKSRLEKAGFEFDYHTHFKKTKMGNYTYTFCFDYGYREVKDYGDKKDRYKVVKAFAEKED